VNAIKNLLITPISAAKEINYIEKFISRIFPIISPMASIRTK
jgi:hypothetical protein